jgi:hypothetical protein
MPDLPPYVGATEHLPVHAVIRAARHVAVVLGWRGDRVYLNWHTKMGKHLSWVRRRTLSDSRFTLWTAPERPVRGRLPPPGRSTNPRVLQAPGALLVRVGGAPAGAQGLQADVSERIGLTGLLAAALAGPTPPAPPPVAGAVDSG